MGIATTIFSALGNNSSLYPIIFKDGVDITGRTVMAYTEGSKTNQKYGLYGARESFLEETTTSVVWLAGIPALKLFYDRVITNKVFNFPDMPELGSPLDKKGSRVFADTNLKLLDNGLQTFEENIAEIKEILRTKPNPVLQKIVEYAEKILAKKAKFKKLYAGKMAFATLVPLATIGFVLPKLIQKMTKVIYKNDKELSEKRFSHYNNNNPPKVFAAFCGKSDSKDNNNVPFKGKFSNLVIDVFNNDVSNQLLLDGGIFAGRVATGVNFADKVEKAIKEAGIVFFIYLGGRIVGGMIEKISQKLGMPIHLDSKILEDDTFKNEIKGIADGKEKINDFVKFPEYKDSSFKKLFQEESHNLEFQKLGLFDKIKSIKAKQLAINIENERNVLRFIKDEVKTGVKNNTFINPTLREAQKLGLIELIEDARNPFQHLNTNAIKGLNASIKEYAEKALSKGSVEEVEKFLKKSVATKRGGIILNLAICSAFTGYIIPKLQYIFREKYTKTTHLPSLATYDKQIQAEKLA